MDGWQFLRVASNYVGLMRIPVVIVSGHPPRLNQTNHDGVIGVLHSPYEMRELIALVAAVFHPTRLASHSRAKSSLSSLSRKGLRSFGRGTLLKRRRQPTATGPRTRCRESFATRCGGSVHREAKHKAARWLGSQHAVTSRHGQVSSARARPMAVGPHGKTRRQARVECGPGRRHHRDHPPATRFDA